VYPLRPSPCRELELGDERCDRARTRHGLDLVPKPIQVERPGLQSRGNSSDRQIDAPPGAIVLQVELDMNG
jgi:hypothetical protein